MILGTGIDMIEVGRVEKAARNDLFYTRIFSENELALFEARSKNAQTVAANFAAKEAVLKCLACGLGDVPLIDIEILRTASGRPYASLYGKAKTKADALGIKQIHISISHTSQYALAQAVAEGE